MSGAPNPRELWPALKELRLSTTQPLQLAALPVVLCVYVAVATTARCCTVSGGSATRVSSGASAGGAVLCSCFAPARQLVGRSGFYFTDEPR